MKPRYCIVDLSLGDCTIFDEVKRAKLLSTVTMKGHTIVARYEVNKTTLKKILKNYLKMK